MLNIFFSIFNFNNSQYGIGSVTGKVGSEVVGFPKLQVSGIS